MIYYVVVCRPKCVPKVEYEAIFASPSYGRAMDVLTEINDKYPLFQINYRSVNATSEQMARYIAAKVMNKEDTTPWDHGKLKGEKWP